MPHAFDMPNKPLHILIVEDDRDVAALLSYRIRSSGHEVSLVTSGSEVIAAVREKRPDGIVLDLMLPDITGLGVCRMLRAAPQTTEIPIIVVTAKNDPETQETLLAAGADFFLGKHGFLKAVDRVIAGLAAPREIAQPNLPVM